jgi:hypothetical protein
MRIDTAGREARTAVREVQEASEGGKERMERFRKHANEDEREKREFAHRVAEVGRRRLIDVSELAEFAGLKAAVLLTGDVWNACVVVPDDCPHQEPAFRLLAVLSGLRAATQEARDGARVPFTVAVHNDGQAERTASLVAIAHDMPTPEQLAWIVCLHERP